MDRKTILGCLSAILLLVGCGSKHRIVVGSKNFTEQVILGEIVAQHLENRLHQKVERRLNLGGTMLAHQALISKDIDLYPEYTGTAFTNVLKRSGVNDPVVVLDRVRSEYLTAMHLEWLDPLGFESSFAMTVLGAEAKARHLETLSDAAADPAGFALGAGYEFTLRPDGLGALNEIYGIRWTAPPKSMDLGLLYTALLQRHVTMIASNTTDGMLDKLDVKVLKDDKQAFPPYQACIVVRSDTLAATPNLRRILSELSGKIPEKTMRSMNYAVDAQHQQVRETARSFLQRAGLL
ncbi:MAG TPA: glycine betaine ABC transporter substrate-binding protein [Bryobacteraceae bacterium]|nr:glycine betaine ABC transporter substrate-binding protein [Bryobacteraceae bacterium]